jgi:cell division protein FtsL
MAVPARSTIYVGAWLAVIALLLIGLVGLRVSLLYKNIEFNELIKEKNDLRVENDRLSSEVSVLSSPERIEQIATGRLGMVPSGRVQYVYISPPDSRQYADLDAGGVSRTRMISP